MEKQAGRSVEKTGSVVRAIVTPTPSHQAAHSADVRGFMLWDVEPSSARQELLSPLGARKAASSASNIDDTSSLVAPILVANSKTCIPLQTSFRLFERIANSVLVTAISN
jgi:hypothetical protein